MEVYFTNFWDSLYPEILEVILMNKKVLLLSLLVAVGGISSTANAMGWKDDPARHYQTPVPAPAPVETPGRFAGVKNVVRNAGVKALAVGKLGFKALGALSAASDLYNAGTSIWAGEYADGFKSLGIAGAKYAAWYYLLPYLIANVPAAAGVTGNWALSTKPAIWFADHVKANAYANRSSLSRYWHGFVGYSPLGA